MMRESFTLQQKTKFSHKKMNAVCPSLTCMCHDVIFRWACMIIFSDALQFIHRGMGTRNGDLC